MRCGSRWSLSPQTARNGYNSDHRSVPSGFPAGYGLTVKQMHALGLYIFSHRHGNDVVGPFAEPGLFMVKGDRELRTLRP